MCLYNVCKYAYACVNYCSSMLVCICMHVYMRVKTKLVADGFLHWLLLQSSGRLLKRDSKYLRHILLSIRTCTAYMSLIGEIKPADRVLWVSPPCHLCSKYRSCSDIMRSTTRAIAPIILCCRDYRHSEVKNEEISSQTLVLTRIVEVLQSPI